jgi:hypothetical protein
LNIKTIPIEFRVLFSPTRVLAETGLIRHLTTGKDFTGPGKEKGPEALGSTVYG